MDYLLANIATTEDRNMVLQELDILLKSFFTVKNGFEKALTTDVRQETAEAIRKTIAEKKLAAAAVKIYLQNLKDTIQTYETVTLTLAFSPSEKIVKTISSWVKKNVGENIVIQTRSDSALVGGTTIIFRGKYTDLSLQKPVEEFLRITTICHSEAESRRILINEILRFTQDDKSMYERF